MSAPRDLNHLRDIATADVWKADRFAGTLKRTDTGVEFRYTTAYLDRPGPPVATTLPLSEEPVLTAAGAVPAFFAGLLPEGRRLSSLRRAIKTSADDDLTLLLAVGADPVGDVRVLPEGIAPGATPPLVEVQRSWAEVSFTEVLADAGVRDPVGLAGMQDKASARMLSVPVSRSGHAFILKIDPPEYPRVVEDEAYFMALARRSRFPVAEASVVYDRDGRSGLLVTRFDRMLDLASGSLVALPVEDGTQLLGKYPADKYNLASEQVAESVARVCAARTLALREVFRQVVFAWLTGNGDLHAKNISVLGDRRSEWRVAPAYDIPSTAPYGDRTLALPIGGRRDGISRRTLLEFAERIGVPTMAAEQVLDTALAATEAVFTEWSGNASPFGNEQTHDTLAVLKHRRRNALAP